eukprot:3245292-Rhodomonas_salina.1
MAAWGRSNVRNGGKRTGAAGWRGQATTSARVKSAICLGMLYNAPAGIAYVGATSVRDARYGDNVGQYHPVVLP